MEILREQIGSESELYIKLGQEIDRILTKSENGEHLSDKENQLIALELRKQKETIQTIKDIEYKLSDSQMICNQFP